VREKLPLFPLGTVLFPGLVLPLHIFEDRYRQLIGELRDGPEPRRFGVIAIREGRETGVDSVSALFDIGCTATVREITELEDGRFDIVTVGTDRFRLHGLGDPQPYLTGEVEILGEPLGAEPPAVALAVQAVQQGFRNYLNVLAERGSATINVPDLPDEPLLLSYLIAASMIIELPVRQGMLAQPDAVRRLTAERRLLARETAMLKSLGTTPAPDLLSSPVNPN
jgi:Lon protease-like protein